MTGALWRSALVAAVFAIHPLRVESVAWVAERKDVLSGLFFMLACGPTSAMRAGRFRWRRYGLVVAPVCPGADGQADAGHAALGAACCWITGRWEGREGEKGRKGEREKGRRGKGDRTDSQRGGGRLPALAGFAGLADRGEAAALRSPP